MRSLPVLLIVLVILAASPTSTARSLLLPQSDTGVIRGLVLDPQGAVIPGAEVRATNNQTAQAFMTKSQ